MLKKLNFSFLKSSKSSVSFVEQKQLKNESMENKNEVVYNFPAGFEAAKIARKYVGTTEIPGNQGFLNKSFEKSMRGVGFYTGAPWCGFFVKLTWHQAGLTHSFISASSAQQIESTKKGGPMEDNWHAEPVVGAIAVWAIFRKGKRQKAGHFSLVELIEKSEDDSTLFRTIDGNSNSDGSREGKEVAVRNHTLDERIWKKTEGLRLLGFVWPTSEQGSFLSGVIKK